MVLKRKIETLSHLHANHLKNTLVQHHLHNEGANEANHAGPGVPYLCNFGEPEEGLTQLWLHPGHLNLNRTKIEQATWNKNIFGLPLFYVNNINELCAFHQQPYLFIFRSPQQEALQLELCQL